MNRRIAFTLFEVMLSMVIIVSVMAIGIHAFRRSDSSRLYEEAQKIDAELFRARQSVFNSPCPLRMIPCTDSACGPMAAGSLKGYAFQVYCGTNPPCNLNCNNSDQYLNWDFVKPARFPHPEFEYFAINLLPSDDFSPATSSGLLFPTRSTDPIPTPAALASQITIDAQVYFSILTVGLKGADPTQPGSKDPGYAVTITDGGQTKIARCRNGTCDGS